MNGKQLRIWMATHRYSQTNLAKELGLSTKTIHNYLTMRPPVWLEYALIGLLTVKGK